MIHYLNLSNGLACESGTAEPRYLRIQSTWCEAKRWEDVLWTVSPDFYFNVAEGAEVCVHDVSERSRMTRALWQGLPWIRYACERAWDVPDKHLYRVTVRKGGMPDSKGSSDATIYFQIVYSLMSERARNYLRYFRKYYTPGPLSNIYVCSGPGEGVDDDRHSVRPLSSALQERLREPEDQLPATRPRG